jgi:hypothetical protein
MGKRSTPTRPFVALFALRLRARVKRERCAQDERGASVSDNANPFTLSRPRRGRVEGRTGLRRIARASGFATLAAGLLLLATVPVRAQLGPAPPRVVHFRLASTLGAGFNELVGGWIAKPYVYVPYGSSKNWLFEQSHVRVGLNNVLSPAVARVGAFAGISPALFFDLNVNYWALLDWSAKRFPSMDSAYDTASRDRRPTEFVFGHVFGLDATLKAAAGKGVLQSSWDLDRWLVPDKYFNIEIGTIIETGWRLHGQTVLGYMADERFAPLLEYEYLKYYPTEFEKHSFGAGLLVSNVIPYSNLVGIMAYHLHNPDFSGWKFLFAITSDFPLGKKARGGK